LAIYRRCTGRQTPPSTRPREAALVKGRRAGGSRIVAFVASYLAALVDWTPYLAPGEMGLIAIISADRSQGRVILGYIKAFFENPLMAPLVASWRSDGLELTNGVIIEIRTASFRTIRGFTVLAALCDEIAFWRTDDGSANPDREILAALRPSMATIPNALLVMLSSPYSRRGELWTTYDRYFGKDHDRVLVWQADSRTMNPLIDPEIVRVAYEEDDAIASAEFGGLFRSDIEAFLSREAIDAVTERGRLEIGPMHGVSYRAFVDPSGGAQDSMTLAIGHKHEKTGRGVLDCIREQRAPFSPEATVEAFTQELRQYRIREVTGDRYAGEWPRERFLRHGVTYRTSDDAKSDLYQAFAPLVNGNRCELLDHPVLKRQLLGLERKTTRSGKDSIDHGPRGKDDVANSVAGVLALVTKQPAIRAGAMHCEWL
jgi:hypothetical protein